MVLAPQISVRIKEKFRSSPSEFIKGIILWGDLSRNGNDGWLKGADKSEEIMT